VPSTRTAPRQSPAARSVTRLHPTRREPSSAGAHPLEWEDIVRHPILYPNSRNQIDASHLPSPAGSGSQQGADGRFVAVPDRQGLTISRRTKVNAFSLFLLVLPGLACGSARLRVPEALPPLPHTVDTIALAPNGGVFADQIGLELFSQGFQIVGTNATTNTMVRSGIVELELFEPRSLRILRERGIDAVLLAQTTYSRITGMPETAAVRVQSTVDGTVLAGATWFDTRDRALMNADAGKRIGKALAEMLRRPVAGTQE
jgi:hypothetical protein